MTKDERDLLNFALANKAGAITGRHGTITEFRQRTFRERILEMLQPARRRKRETRLAAEIRRLVKDAPDEEIRFK